MSSTESDNGNEIVETDLAVVSGNPDPEELAALTAVLAEVLDEMAAEQGRRESAATSAWARSQRGVRTPLQPGPGAWRSFSG
ncbi:MAG TPA: acyl-CoA carboxylase subunit epsilon [Galbitalea sp.]